MFSLFYDSRYENDAGNKANMYFFFFWGGVLSVKVCVKMSPLPGKEWTKNYRKKMLKEKLREVHKNDKFRKWKERQQKKLMALRELIKKRRKDREW